MKKIIWIIIAILILIIAVLVVKINDNMQKSKIVSAFNEQFETIYKDKNIYGADVLTIINKAIDNNNSYNIKKDENGNYIEDDNYSLKIELILLSEDEDGKLKEVKYPMETLEKARIRWIYS